MGMRAAIAHRAVRAAHVLVVEVPGWRQTRMTVESESARRGWKPAMSPADADVLVLCGVPGSELRSVYERIWSQLPGPRARASLVAPAEAASVLGQAAADLLDDAAQRSDARMRSPEPQGDTGSDMDMHSDMDMDMHSDMDMDMDMHSDMEMDMDMHSDMEMDMPMPGGIPLAGGASDRDGLEMDVLHVPLGPVLPQWPAGLVLRCVLQGDVIVSAVAEVLPAGANRPTVPAANDGADGPRRSAVIQRCDDAAHLVAIAGWGAAALHAQRVRDELLRGRPLEDCPGDLARLMRRIGRSWLLRWSLRGIGSRDGTARDRLIGWLREALQLAEGAVAPNSHSDGSLLQRQRVDSIASLVTGSDLATARLLVAGLAIDTDALLTVEAHAHG